MKLTVRSITAFSELLNSALKIVPSAIFVVDEQGVTINCANETGTVRAFLKSDCIISEVAGQFALKDLTKLRKSLDVVKKVEKVNSIVISVGKVFLTYTNKTKFKLRQVMPELIERFVCAVLKAEILPIYSFTTNGANVKTAIKCSAIIPSDDNKVYFSVENGRIIAEIDNKQDDHADCVGIPINNESDGIVGSVDKVIATKLDNFRLFALMDVDDIKVTFTNKAVFQVDATKETDGYSTSLMMITSTVKG